MKTNNWVLFLKQKSKETGISYMCLISNKEIQNEYKNYKKGIQTTKTEPLQEDTSSTRIHKLTKMIEDFSTKYELKSLKSQVTGGSFNERKSKALIVAGNFDDDDEKIGLLLEEIKSDDIDILNLFKDNKEVFIKYQKLKKNFHINLKRLVKG